MGGVGHTGGLTNPHPWRGQCRAGYSKTSGPPLSRKRAPYYKNNEKGLAATFEQSSIQALTQLNMA